MMKLKLYVVRGAHVEMGICVIAARDPAEAVELFSCPGAPVMAKRLRAEEILYGGDGAPAVALGDPRIVWSVAEYRTR